MKRTPEPPTEMGLDLTLDRICGEWWIHQLKKGQRFSTDDVVCAWAAAELRPQAKRLIDIGAGIGSVGLQTLWRMGPGAHSTFVEVQEISHRLCKRTVGLNGLQDRVELRHGDLRDPAMLPESEHGSFDLVTGSPPYFPVGTAVMSSNPQRAGARMELKGCVFDYCAAAAKLLKPDGGFSLVHTAHDPRPEAALEAAGLTIWSRHDVYFRVGRPPTIAVWTAGFGGKRAPDQNIVVRDEEGAWTPSYRRLLDEMGAPRR